jgi:hypothetical protein
LIKSCAGIVAALAFLFCCSQADAKDPLVAGLKLMADRPESQGPEWVLYEDMPEDGDIVSFNQAGDGDGAFEICQSEEGTVGSIVEMQGGAVCETKDGAKESFYVLHLGDQDDQEAVEEDEGETGGFAKKLQKKVRDHQSEKSVGTGMLPDFDWDEAEQEEMSDAIREALEATDAWQRYLDEGPETQGASDLGAWLK